MSRHVAGVTLDNLEHLPKKCRSCVFWELAPHLRVDAEKYGQTDFEKEAWVSSVLLDWGCCGQIVYRDQTPAGYALYAPPGAVPGSAAFPTAPVSADAVLLTSLRVPPAFAGQGLGRMLVQAVAGDLTRRGVRAIEAFGDAAPEPDSTCVIPADFLLAVGFEVVRPHARWPRLRMELGSGLSWQEGVEAALERLLNSVTIVVAEPAPAGAR
ncbi:MAG TPA: GNAT family N-acetyltransferase [Pseudonocardiaceae bacterium]